MHFLGALEAFLIKDYDFVLFCDEPVCKKSVELGLVEPAVAFIIVEPLLKGLVLYADFITNLPYPFAEPYYLVVVQIYFRIKELFYVNQVCRVVLY